MRSGFLTLAFVAALAGFTFNACDDDDDNASKTSAFDTHAVDLGLPSGLLWADQNVDANTPEEYGDYFAWAETETKNSYYWDTYKYGDGKTFTKYVPKGDEGGKNGFYDNKTVLDRADDAASQNWGGQWRTPTINEWQELLDNCTWTWTPRGEVNGYLVTGPSGNSIFLPAGGFRRYGFLDYNNSYGNYWSASLIDSDIDSVYELYFNNDSQSVNNRFRYYGRSIRPVRN